MNLAALRAAAKGGYALPETDDDPRLTDAQWNRALNRGYRWLARSARLLPGKWTAISTQENIREYSIANLVPGVAGIQFVLFKRGGTTGSWRPLSRLPPDQLIRVVSDWHDETGGPLQYYLRGSTTLGLRPTPDADNAGAFLEIWGWAFPTELTSDTATDATGTPILDANLHEHLLDPARYEMARQELADGRAEAANLIQLYDAGRQQSLLECRSYVEMLIDEPEYVSMAWSEDY